MKILYHIYIMHLTFQNQILLGTVLGGSSLIKTPSENCYVSMRNKNQKWLLYKSLQMKKYFHNKEIKQYGNTYRINSKCYLELLDFYEILYEKDKKIITMNILDSLRDVALAVWFLDNGSVTGRNKKNVYLNTTKYGIKGTEIMLKYFNEVGMECNINKDKNRLKILFTVNGSRLFLKTTSYHFPNFMFNRINNVCHILSILRRENPYFPIE